MTLDQTDLEILKLLQANSRISLKSLSKKVFLSQPSTKNRLNRLIDEDYIKQFTIDLNYKKLGYTLAFIIRITNISVNYNELATLLKSKNEFTEIFSVTGSDVYIIKGFTKTTDDLEELLAELMNYGEVNTSIILDSYPYSDFLDLLIN